VPAEAGHVYDDVAAYYTDRILRFGATPPGVDWTCVPTQEMRFVQLLKVCDFRLPFALNDLGCGYGALLAYLDKRHRRADIDYLGVDVSPAMVAQARRLWHRRPRTVFAEGSRMARLADYSVASGIFNVKLAHSRARWEAAIRDTLADMHACSRSGFAVNFLLPAGGRGPRELYRASPTVWGRFCEREFSCGTAVLEGYGLREFTLLARKRLSSPPAAAHAPFRA